MLLHAARDLVLEGVPVAEAARRKGLSRSNLRRFMKKQSAPSVSARGAHES